MSFNWVEFQRVADALFQAASKVEEVYLQEAFCRSAISRAYYSAFNVSLRKTWGGDSIKSAEIHQFVINRFKNFDPENTGDSKKRNAYRLIGTNLERLRTYRNKADYDDKLEQNSANQVNPMKQAEIAIKLAQRILQTFQDHA
jgi:uncharacterized protein (UPF0332 family)